MPASKTSISQLSSRQPALLGVTTLAHVIAVVVKSPASVAVEAAVKAAVRAGVKAVVAASTGVDVTVALRIFRTARNRPCIEAPAAALRSVGRRASAGGARLCSQASRIHACAARQCVRTQTAKPWCAGATVALASWLAPQVQTCTLHTGCLLSRQSEGVRLDAAKRDRTGCLINQLAQRGGVMRRAGARQQRGQRGERGRDLSAGRRGERRGRVARPRGRHRQLRARPQ